MDLHWDRKNRFGSGSTRREGKTKDLGTQREPLSLDREGKPWAGVEDKAGWQRAMLRASEHGDATRLSGNSGETKAEDRDWMSYASVICWGSALLLSTGESWQGRACGLQIGVQLRADIAQGQLSTLIFGKLLKNRNPFLRITHTRTHTTHTHTVYAISAGIYIDANFRPCSDHPSLATQRGLISRTNFPSSLTTFP